MDAHGFPSGYLDRHWLNNSLTFLIDEVTFQPPSQKREAAAGAILSWHWLNVPGSNFSPSWYDSIGTVPGVQDFRNVIAFGQTPDPTMLAVTYPWFYSGTPITTRAEADIVINSSYTWEAEPFFVDKIAPYDNYSLEMVIRHEVGHAVGLSGPTAVSKHENTYLANMNPKYSYGGGDDFWMHGDDRNGLRTLYPGSGTEDDIQLKGWFLYNVLDTVAIPVPAPSPTTLATGQTISVSYTIENLGTTFHYDTNHARIEFYLCQSPTVSIFDTPMGYVDIGLAPATGGVGVQPIYTGVKQLTIPCVSTPIQYPADFYIGAICYPFQNGFPTWDGFTNNNYIIFPYPENPTKITITSGPPPAPTNLVATDSLCDRIDLRWHDNSSNEVRFLIYRNAVLIDSTSTNDTTFTDTPSLGTYTYEVRARSNVCPSLSAVDQGTRRGVPQGAPSLNEATVSDCQEIALSWTFNGSGQTGFRVFRDGQSPAIYTGTTPGEGSWSDNSTVAGVPHSYTVRAYNNCGDGPASGPRTGTRAVAPGTVATVTASDSSCAAIFVSWIWGGAGQLGFNIYRDNSATPTFTVGPNLPYAKVDPVGGAVGVHTYTVKASYPGNCLGPSSPASSGELLGLPTYTPQNLAASDFGCNDITLTWTHSGADQLGFEILRDNVQIAALPDPGARAFTDIAAAPNTTYFYRVRAYNSCGSGPVSGQSSGTRQPGPPSVSPGGVIASDGGLCCIATRVTWQWGGAGQQGFRVYRNGVAAFADTIPGQREWLDTSASPGVTYSYSVLAYNGCGDGPVSAPDQGTRCTAVTWSPDGIPVNIAGGPSFALGIRATPDGAGGTVVVWSDKRNGTDYDVYAQRLSSDGTPCWTTNGVPVCVAPGDQTDPDVAEDGSGIAGEGGVVVVWMDGRKGTTNTDIYAQRIRLDGALEPTVYNGIVCGAPGTQTSPRVAKAPNAAEQGVIIVWDDDRTGERDIYGQRLLHSAVGTWPSQFDTLGIPICAATGFQWFPKIVPDGAGGAFVCWADERLGYGQSDIFGQRVDASGGLQWPANGVNLIQQCFQAGGGYPRFKIIADGQGGALVSAEALLGGNPDSMDVRVQRVTSSGSTLWGNRGALAGGGQYWQFEPDVVSDGAAGAVVTWRSRKLGGSDIYVQRLDATGNPMWLPGGTRVSHDTGDEIRPRILPDGAGGWLVAWTQVDSTYNTHIWARSLGSDGSVNGSPLGTQVSPTAGTQFHEWGQMDMVPGSQGTAVIAYEHWTTADHADVYASLVDPAASGGPDLAQSFFAPQAGTTTSPFVGTTAIQFFRACPNNDGGASLFSHARLKIVVVDGAGVGMAGIAAEDVFVALNGGTSAQGFYGSGADSIISNSQVIDASPQCPDLRYLTADAPTNASGVTYITFAGASATNPGVTVRNPGRKWGHYDSDLPVYVLGRRLQGRLTEAAANGSYVLQIKNFDVIDGLGVAVDDARESHNSTDYNAIVNGVGINNAVSFWKDLDWNGAVDASDFNMITNHSISNHLPHDCQFPNNDTP